MDAAPSQPPPHFLVVTFPAQGHLNPALHLAKRLATSTTARVSFSTAVAAHRRMFPSHSSDSKIAHGGITYIPFNDGSSSSSSSLHNPNEGDLRSSISRIKQLGSHHLNAILRELAGTDHPVTCVIYTIMLQWAGDVARDLGIPSALYWIQAATVLSMYHHFFHGYEPLIAAHAKDPFFPISFPSLPLFEIRDLPTFFTITTPDEPFFDILQAFRHVFQALSVTGETEQKPKVLVNSFDELEPEALASMTEHLELLSVGPVVPDEPEKAAADMFDQDEKVYMEWLDAQEKGSVVYVAFGSVHRLSREEMVEIGKGLSGSRRPYLWVVRKDSRWEGFHIELNQGEQKQGMLVEWCSQLRVLAHRAVGCFVTHCGWNSTVECLISGVPALAMPAWSDQTTNAWLMERAWGTAVKADASEDGRVTEGELRRCLEIIMGEGDRGVAIRRKAEMWKEKARKAVSEGGSSGRNLKAFTFQRK